MCVQLLFRNESFRKYCELQKLIHMTQSRPCQYVEPEGIITDFGLHHPCFYVNFLFCFITLYYFVLYFVL